MKRFVGIALVIVGAVLLFWGYQSQQQLGHQLSRSITGSLPEDVWQYYVTGVIAVVVGGFSIWKSK